MASSNMVLNDTYYLLKPMLPWRLRGALRRMRANCRRNICADVWPIDSAAGMMPPGWPGWPDGRRFALVLTHDVEGSKGLSGMEQLVRLEQEHGFRSCFNFVPKGEYQVSDDLRKVLGESGFEVGVHGLDHDGKRYHSKSKFAKDAEKIRS